MADAVYRENRAGIAAMLRADYMVAEMRRRMELGRIEAERISPVRTGAYAFGLPGAPGVTGGGFKVSAGVRRERAYGRLSNDVQRNGFCYAAALEWGTRYMAKQRPLGKAIDAIASKR